VNVIGAAVLFVTSTASELVAPTFTVPKFSAVGVSVSGELDVTASSEMYSSDTAASEAISTAPYRAVIAEVVVGANSTLMLHVLPGASVAQSLVTVKSCGDATAPKCKIVVPVFCTVTLCAADEDPVAVFANVSAPSDSEYAASTAPDEGDEETTGPTEPCSNTVIGLVAASD